MDQTSMPMPETTQQAVDPEGLQFDNMMETPLGVPEGLSPRKFKGTQIPGRLVYNRRTGKFDFKPGDPLKNPRCVVGDDTLKDRDFYNQLEALRRRGPSLPPEPKTSAQKIMEALRGAARVFRDIE